MTESGDGLFTRREALGTLAATGAVIVAAGATARAQGEARPPRPGPDSQPSGEPPAFAAQHQVAPLPFDPPALRGISERLIVSHHDNNYAAAVRSLNRVEQELSRVTPDTPPFIVGGLKERELVFRNSMVLHESYFANLGGPGQPSDAVRRWIGETWGTYDRWEALFRATASSLGGGTGWVVLAHDFHRNAVTTYWAGDHSRNHAASLPLLVMDMYEHAYQMDYGAAHARYIDAFFQNIHWDVVVQRAERARRALAALRG